MGEDVGFVETGHGDFGDDHFEEGGEGGEDALLSLVVAEAGGSGEVAAFHDAAGDVDLGVGFADVVEAAGAFEVGVDDFDGGDAFFGGHGGEEFVDDFAEGVAVFAGAGGAGVGDGGFVGLDGFEHVDGFGVAALGEVIGGDAGLDDIVAVDGAFEGFDAGGHFAFVDEGDGAFAVDGAADADEEAVEVFALADIDGEAVAFEGFGDAVAGEVIAGVAGDGDIIVIDEEFDVEILGDGHACGLGVVAFHFGAVGAEEEYGFFRVGEGDAVGVGPHVAEASGGEFDAGEHVAFGVAGDVGEGFTVVEKFFEGDIAIESGEEVLGGDAVAGFIEEDGEDGVAAGGECAEDEDFGDGIEGAAGVAAETACVGDGGEEDDGIAAEGDVGLEDGLLVGREVALVEAEGEGLEVLEGDGEGHGNLRRLT